MAMHLPPELSSGLDRDDPLASIKALTLAVEAGELELSALVSYAKGIANGRGPKVPKALPVPIEMLQAIRDRPDIPARKIVYGGVVDGLWSMDDAESFERNAELLSERSKNASPRRGVYLTRSRRTDRARTRTDGRFVPKMSMDVMAIDSLCDGAVKCLGILLSLAGRENRVTTYTSSIATAMRRTTRTVRNYFIALEDAGLIRRNPGKLFNTVDIVIDPICRPEPYEEPRDMKAFRLARRSAHTGLHLMAMTLVAASLDVHSDHFTTSDRRKEISVFNPESIPKERRSEDMATPKLKVIGSRAASTSRPIAATTHSTLLGDPRYPSHGTRWFRQ